MTDGYWARRDLPGHEGHLVLDIGHGVRICQTCRATERALVMGVSKPDHPSRRRIDFALLVRLQERWQTDMDR